MKELGPFVQKLESGITGQWLSDIEGKILL